MGGIDEISEAIGSLRSEVRTLNNSVNALNSTVQTLQQTRWTARGIYMALAAVSGGLGGKVAALFSGTTPPNFPH